jgi:hypothetical protein
MRGTHLVKLTKHILTTMKYAKQGEMYSWMSFFSTYFLHFLQIRSQNWNKLSMSQKFTTMDHFL